MGLATDERGAKGVQGDDADDGRMRVGEAGEGGKKRQVREDEKQGGDIVFGTLLACLWLIYPIKYCTLVFLAFDVLSFMDVLNNLLALQRSIRSMFLLEKIWSQSFFKWLVFCW